MAYFYIIFILLFIASVLFRKNKTVGIFLLALMSFMCAFRGINVGSDTVNYYLNNFDHSFSLSSASSYDAEFLFVLLTNTVSSLGLNPRLCLFSLSLITFIFLLLSIKRFRLTNDVSYVLVAFFFFSLGFYAMSFNIARQIAASTVVLYAYSYLTEKGKEKNLFFVFVLLASSIHISSIIFLSLYFTRWMSLKWFSKHIYLTILMAVALYLAMQLFKDVMLSSLFSHLSIMAFYEKYAALTEQSTVSLVGFVFAISEFVICLFCFRRLSRKGSDSLATLLFLSVVMTIVLSAFYGNIYRLRIGLTIIEPIAIASVFSGRAKLKGKRLILFLICAVLFGYESLSSLAGGAYEIIPYYITL